MTPLAIVEFIGDEFFPISLIVSAIVFLTFSDTIFGLPLFTKEVLLKSPLFNCHFHFFKVPIFNLEPIDGWFVQKKSNTSLGFRKLLLSNTKYSVTIFFC